MSKSNAFENGMLLLWYNNTTFAGVGDAGGLLQSVADGSLYVSLHTGDPGEAGDQTTSECAYTSYVRTAVARTTGGWTVAANVASNAAAVVWIEATGGSETATYYGVGTDSSGAGILLCSGILTASLVISNGVEPRSAIGAITHTED